MYISRVTYVGKVSNSKSDLKATRSLKVIGIAAFHSIGHMRLSVSLPLQLCLSCTVSTILSLQGTNPEVILSLQASYPEVIISWKRCKTDKFNWVTWCDHAPFREGLLSVGTWWQNDPLYRSP